MEITADHVVEAFARWQEFSRAAAPLDAEERVEKFAARLRAGEDPKAVLSELAKPVDGSALESLGRGVGLGQEAYAAFLLGLSEALQGYQLQPIETALDSAAFMGLIVGLTAKRSLKKTRFADLLEASSLAAPARRPVVTLPVYR